MTLAWWSIWWIWMVAAFVMAILEVVVPAYVFLGFAIGAFGLGLIILVAGLTLSLGMSLVVFAVLSLAAYAVLRRLFGMNRGQVKIWKSDIND